MFVRRFIPADSPALARIFYDAVQIGAAADYTQVERDAWCAAQPSDDWAITRFAGLKTFVACAPDPVGFMGIDQSGYLDLAFVTPAHAGQGVARLLHHEIVAYAVTGGLSQMTTYASLTARPAFEAMGWDVIRANTVEKGRVTLQNWFMIKSLLA